MAQFFTEHYFVSTMSVRLHDETGGQIDTGRMRLPYNPFPPYRDFFHIQMTDSVPVPLPDEQLISRMDVYIHNTADDHEVVPPPIKPLLDILPYAGIPKDVFKETSCPICLEDYVDGVEVVDLPCSHLFHHKCIETWAITHPECPLCRRAIPYEHEEVEEEAETPDNWESIPDIISTLSRHIDSNYYNIDHAEDIEEPDDSESSQASSRS
jgi:hypothetical protein